MSRALFDVNVLIALLDPDHVAHERVHEWVATSMTEGWATCAITENGVVRVLSQPAYPGCTTVTAALELLSTNTADAAHEFWPCDVSITADLVRPERLLGHRQVTDAYLLALAVHHGGRLVTLDAKISRAVVPKARPEHLVTI